MRDTECSIELDANSPRFVTAADCFIPHVHKDILSDFHAVVYGDVFLAPFGRQFPSRLTIAPSLVRFHD